MRKNLLVLFLISAFLLPSAVSAQTVKISAKEKKMAENITADQLKNYLYFVASDEMEGRDTPSRGLDTTAKFIGMNLARWGFKPAGDDGTFYQNIALHRDSVVPAETSIEVGGQKFAYGEDIVRVSGNSTGAVSAPIVYAGNGWLIKSKNLNPYEGLDVKGKLIAVYGEGLINGRNLVPLPAGVTQADLSGERGKDWADAVTYARSNGAAGVIVLPSKFLSDNWSGVTGMFGRSRVVVDKFADPIPNPGIGAGATSVFIASPKLAAALFNGESANPLTAAANSFELSGDKKLSFNIVTRPEALHTQNVVALWEGSDPKLKEEMIAIGAHYDHIGISSPASPNPDKINNGADDDGSGTVSVLSIAEALAKSPQRPKRSILLVWHCGEEKGLWGSEYFNKYPTVNIKNVITQLNIDMIGRSKKADNTDPRNKDLSGENAVYVIGSEMMSTTLGAITKGTNDAFLKLTYDLRYDDPNDKNRFFYRSDHFNYALNGIPIVFWFDGVHEDYHQPGDEPQKIDYVKMQNVARTIFLTMLELSDLKERPKIDKQLPPELTKR